MVRRRYYPKNPVAARQRKLVAQGIGLALLFAVATFLVFKAITAT